MLSFSPFDASDRSVLDEDVRRFEDQPPRTVGPARGRMGCALGKPWVSPRHALDGSRLGRWRLLLDALLRSSVAFALPV